MNKPSLSFPRRWSLKKPDSFQNLYREGFRLRGETITLFYRPVAAGLCRIGFSTRKKLAGAVGRNRARRLMREVFRLHQHEIRKDMEYLLVWTGPVPGAALADAEREILELLRRGNLLK